MDAREHFHDLLASLRPLLRAGENFTLDYRAEASDFVRFNQAQVRQAGQVQQVFATLALYLGERHARFELSLTGVAGEDRSRLRHALERLRAVVPSLAPDPYLRLNREPWRSESAEAGTMPDGAAVVGQIVEASASLDLVGIYTAGPQYHGFASSWGALGWHAASSFNFDWSLFHANGQAVKSAYAGQRWDALAFARRMASAREQLEYLGRPALTLAPGDYRAYLAPVALDEIFDLLSGGFSAQALASGASPLQRLFAGQAQLSPLLHLHERIAGGLAPAFTSEGPRRDLRLLAGGLPGERLVGSRSAAEYGLSANGAGAHEYPLSPVVTGGDLDEGDILSRLDTGLYIGNLWYLNFSDRPAGRLTGMTRFATFWVENGRLHAPVNTMRFDDSVFSFLGPHLEALTREPETILPSGTYGARQSGSRTLPGALLGRFTLTL
ncbi:Predicted Zn-dependent protease or its inactivated homolog [Azotobacter beijerinckii]|uniref:Predicted Zn-dependent protease or its inactivated homolog n=1 Tax=Azotobacter beijerinckii TaxID=170623 RepID=A0A1H6XNE0_9GAMM|nr:metallopeptidase TldD-related protein [Azotobacter beijerinckii]SEJ29666.1 Predicted Zn-dependent protease or its inactivated homolog [Azotobacter beijerinckii]